MEIVLATHNKNKIREIEKLLSEVFADITVLSAVDVGVDDIEETGSTFEENAMIKAMAVWKPGRLTLADDSGLCVNALDGEPGLYSARYAGEPANDAKNNEKLLNRLAPFSDRSAYFICTIACILPDGRRFFVEGRSEGTILHQAAGSGGFGYDPLFFSTDVQKTFAELSLDEKNSVSHRGRALQALKTKLALERL